MDITYMKSKLEEARALEKQTRENRMGGGIGFFWYVKVIDLYEEAIKEIIMSHPRGNPSNPYYSSYYDSSLPWKKKLQDEKIARENTKQNKKKKERLSEKIKKDAAKFKELTHIEKKEKRSKREIESIEKENDHLRYSLYLIHLYHQEAQNRMDSIDNILEKYKLYNNNKDKDKI